MLEAFNNLSTTSSFSLYAFSDAMPRRRFIRFRYVAIAVDTIYYTNSCRNVSRACSIEVE